MTPDAPTRGRAGRALALDGILLIDKPAGISSAAAVSRVKRTLGAAKVGHLGTLDPFASGLLPLCVGEGTKLAPYLNTADKAYEGVVRLGISTDTLDATGSVVATAAPPSLTDLDLDGLAREFTGAKTQVPPAFSAIKRGGKRMYELARRGEAPSLEPRAVVIYELGLEPLDGERIRIRLRCSKGTYVRALARDMGERLGCGAMLESLVRTGFGAFTLGEAIDPTRLDPAAASSGLVSLEKALAHLRTLHVDGSTAARLRAGQQAGLGALDRPHSTGERARVLGPDERVVAVVAESGHGWKLERVFHAAASCAP